MDEFDQDDAQEGVLIGGNRTDEAPKPIRDDRGRWVKGTPATNPNGRPSLSADLPTLEGLRAGVTADRVKEVLDGLYEIVMDIKKGAAHRVKAAEVYLGYALGRPAQSVNLNIDKQTYDMTLPSLPDSDETAKVLSVGEVFESGVLSDKDETR